MTTTFARRRLHRHAVSPKYTTLPTPILSVSWEIFRVLRDGRFGAVVKLSISRRYQACWNRLCYSFRAIVNRSHSSTIYHFTAPSTLRCHSLRLSLCLPSLFCNSQLIITIYKRQQYPTLHYVQHCNDQNIHFTTHRVRDCR